MNDCCRDAVAQAVRDERRRCAEAVCVKCRRQLPESQPVYTDKPLPVRWFHETATGHVEMCRAAGIWTRAAAIRSQPPLSPTTPEPESLTKLEAFVAAFAARRKCDDEPDKCGFGSGPYCSQHGDPYIDDAIDAARALVATHGQGNP